MERWANPIDAVIKTARFDFYDFVTVKNKSSWNDFTATDEIESQIWIPHVIAYVNSTRISSKAMIRVQCTWQYLRGTFNTLWLAEQLDKLLTNSGKIYDFKCTLLLAWRAKVGVNWIMEIVCHSMWFTLLRSNEMTGHNLGKVILLIRDLVWKHS